MSTTLCLGQLGAPNPSPPKTAPGPITTTKNVITPASTAQAIQIATTNPELEQAGPYAIQTVPASSFDLSSIDFTSMTTWLVIAGAIGALYFMLKKS